MIDIHIKSIPIAEMRIPGSYGDYWHEGPRLEIRVAECDNVDYETLISIHEIVEEWLTKRRGLTEEEIQAFDEMWDKEHHPDDQEPGFDPRAPYLREHTVADALERLLCAFANIKLHDYEETLAHLETPPMVAAGTPVPGL